VHEHANRDPDVDADAIANCHADANANRHSDADRHPDSDADPDPDSNADSLANVRTGHADADTFTNVQAGHADADVPANVRAGYADTDVHANVRAGHADAYALTSACADQTYASANSCGRIEPDHVATNVVALADDSRRHRRADRNARGSRDSRVGR
jgi:hypothetical protein